MAPPAENIPYFPPPACISGPVRATVTTAHPPRAADESSGGYLVDSRDAVGSLWAEDTVNQERYRVHEIEGLWAGPLASPPAA
jgi:hypothetical protein